MRSDPTLGKTPKRLRSCPQRSTHQRHNYPTVRCVGPPFGALRNPSPCPRGTAHSPNPSQWRGYGHVLSHVIVILMTRGPTPWHPHPRPHPFCNGALKQSHPQTNSPIPSNTILEIRVRNYPSPVSRIYLVMLRLHTAINRADFVSW